MKRKFQSPVWLLASPVVALLIPLGVRFWRCNIPLRHTVGGNRIERNGERTALASLSYYLEKNSDPKIVSTRYWVTQPKPEPRNASPRREKLYSEWSITIEYNRQTKKLIKYVKNAALGAPEIRRWEWDHVEEAAIHEITAPVRVLKNWKKIDAYHGGNLDELKKYGATMREEVLLPDEMPK